MTLSAQMRVLAISAGCPTVEKIAVFRDRKWDSPESGISGFLSFRSFYTISFN
jgi:hypothetical protein